MSNTIFGRTKDILKKATSSILLTNSGKNREEKRLITKNQSNHIEPKFNMKDFNVKYEDEALKKNSYSNHKKWLSDFPMSNGSKYYLRQDLKLGILSDDIFFNTYEPVANTIRVNEQNYQTLDNQIDVLLIAFNLEDLPKEWSGLGSSTSEIIRNKLIKIIKHLKNQKKTVVYYSLDETEIYKRLNPVIKACDVILTIQKSSADYFKSENLNNKIHVLKLGINPLIHNPIGTRLHKYKKKVALYEYWDPKNQRRKNTLSSFINSAVSSDNEVVVYDTLLQKTDKSFAFPKDFHEYLAPTVNPEYKYAYLKFFESIYLFNEYKEKYFPYNRNLNEFMALGNTIITNYHSDIHNRFPNIYIGYSKKEIQEILSKYSDNDIYENQMTGVRNIFKQDTVFERFNDLCSILNIEFIKKERKIAILTKEKTDHVVEMFQYQTYPNKDLFLENEFTEKMKQQYDMIAFFSDDYQYGEFYLEDLVNGFKYTFCDYISKDMKQVNKVDTNGNEHNYVNEVNDKCSTLFWSNSFKLATLLNMEVGQSLNNGYRVDHFELDKKVVKQPAQAKNTYKLSMIIPVYNNGLFLLNKCFQSLKRSSLFNDMEILLIDDGSTDKFTPNMVKRLSRQYENVSYYFFNDGGSGSASRPRNKGVEMISTEFVTFLDPDNEAVHDGYARLYEEISTNDFDLVVGNIYRVSDREMRLNYVSAVKNANNQQDIIENTRDVLIESAFKIASIQALIIRKSLITDNHLTQVVGAAGEDSLFFKELVINSKRIKLVEEDIHIYYADVEGSVVNTITANFFKKYYMVQPYQVKFLKDQSLLEEYAERRFEYYFKEWILKKLMHVKHDDAVEAVKYSIKIWDFYKDYVKITEPVLARFDELSKLKEYDKIIAEYINP